jgi:hypothetical protein
MPSGRRRRLYSAGLLFPPRFGGTEAIPFGVRRCWRVREPGRAEQIVHKALAGFRVRDDREFLRIDFVIAAQTIQNALATENLEIRTLHALAGLTVEIVNVVHRPASSCVAAQGVSLFHSL